MAQPKAIGPLALLFLVQATLLAQPTRNRPYDYRQSAEFLSLDASSQRKINRVVDDFDKLETALNKFMADHKGQPPESLAQLVPKYLPALPSDPFAKTKRTDRKPHDGYQTSLDGAGYQYQRRTGSAYVTSWKKPIAMYTLPGAWRIKSSGMPKFPLRYNSKNGRGLLRSQGYWGRMILDVF